MPSSWVPKIGLILFVFAQVVGEITDETNAAQAFALLPLFFAIGGIVSQFRRLSPPTLLTALLSERLDLLSEDTSRVQLNAFLAYSGILLSSASFLIYCLVWLRQGKFQCFANPWFKR
jgi:hypothetical protein